MPAVNLQGPTGPTGPAPAATIIGPTGPSGPTGLPRPEMPSFTCLTGPGPSSPMKMGVLIQGPTGAAPTLCTFCRSQIPHGSEPRKRPGWRVAASTLR
jgi:hypothetical protein